MSVGELPGTAPSRRLDALVQKPGGAVVGSSIDGAGRDEVKSRQDHAERDGHDGRDGVSSRSGARPTGQLPDCDGSLPSSAIHELRTPLTSIHGYAQILQRSLAENPKAASALGVIVRESGRLTQMLAELSDVVELQNATASDGASDLDVRELVEAAVECAARQDVGKHQIVVDGSGHAPGDARRLTRALTHILANAVLYSPAEAPITVTIVERPDGVRVTVADEGIGVAAEEVERIYQPFVRGTNARQLGGRGLGLGLCIAQAALALDGGSLSHEAVPGGGTAFIVDLPKR
jgi:two-component system OmpR family sensor kinase